MDHACEGLIGNVSDAEWEGGVSFAMDGRRGGCGVCHANVFTFVALTEWGTTGRVVIAVARLAVVRCVCLVVRTYDGVVGKCEMRG